ncbi:hypothetical protein ABZ318_23205 [Streptomyces sp. NPDC006197]
MSTERPGPTRVAPSAGEAFLAAEARAAFGYGVGAVRSDVLWWTR